MPCIAVVVANHALPTIATSMTIPLAMAPGRTLVTMLLLSPSPAAPLALVALVALALVLPVLAFTMAAAAHGGGGRRA
jgi:hypothetical protein